MQISSARRAAFDILRRVEDGGAFSSVLLGALRDELDGRDRSLCQELVLGVLRRRLWLDKTLEHFAGRQIEKLDLPVVLALRLGLYQLRFLSRVPAAAAVNESVNLVRAARLRSAATFVNAVLRRADRERVYDPADSASDRIERLAIETSHPVWLLQRWIAQFGWEETHALAAANNRPAPLAFRFTAKAIREGRALEILSELRLANVELQRSVVATGGWRVSRATTEQSSAEEPVTQTQAAPFLRKLSAEGLIYFQDEASQLVAELLVTETAGRTLDVCAAPGSKTTLAAALAPDAVIIAGDLYESRIKTVKEFARLQEVRNVRLIVYDATIDLPFNERFDRVLVDAPCSGTGTLRHNPEIRWRLQASDVDELAKRQKLILGNAAAMVDSGGLLVYSTCSVEMDENEAVAEDFIRKQPEFEAAAINASGDLLTGMGSLRTWSHQNDVDGFFVTAFRRIR